MSKEMLINAGVTLVVVVVALAAYDKLIKPNMG